MYLAKNVVQSILHDNHDVEYLTYEIQVQDTTSGEIWTVIVGRIYDRLDFMDLILVEVAAGVVPDGVGVEGIPVLTVGSYPTRIEYFALGHALVHAAQYASLIAAQVAQAKGV
jgi:hypothetical protein